MPITVDLHLHTTASDGRLTPTELVQLAASSGLRTISVSDHDTTAGLAEAQRAADAIPGMRLIPGIELSCDVPGGEVHMLGYFMDIADAGFQAMLARFREGRLTRGEGMVRKLAEFGMPIEWERVLEIAGDASVGRPHIADALVEAGYFKQRSDAFAEYLGRNGKAYVERTKLEPPDAVKLLSEVGGVAVFAHPWFERRGNEPEPEQSLIETVEQLKAAGLPWYGSPLCDVRRRHRGLAGRCRPRLRPDSLRRQRLPPQRQPQRTPARRQRPAPGNRGTPGSRRPAAGDHNHRPLACLHRARRNIHRTAMLAPILTAIGLWAVAGLVGTLPVSHLLARAAGGIDLRRHGSGNIGGSNLAAQLGKAWLPAVVAIDFARGAGPVLLGHYALGLDEMPWLLAVAPLFTVLGNCWSPFLRFTGGAAAWACGPAASWQCRRPCSPALWPPMPAPGPSPRRSAESLLAIMALLPPVCAALPPEAMLLGAPAHLGVYAAAGTAIILVKRLLSNGQPWPADLPRRSVIFNRLFRDRDIADRQQWLSRGSATHRITEAD